MLDHEALLDRRLHGGARVLVLPTPDQQSAIAAIQVWVRAGTSDEQRHEHGCAHLLEHMVFKPFSGRTSGTGNDLASYIEALGGDVNAFTTHDETVFHATVPAAAVEQAASALVRAVLEPVLDADALSHEKQVVVEEIKEADDDPNQLATQAVIARLFGRHSYARPVLGTAKKVLAHSSPRLRAFHRRNYLGRGLVVVIVGPVNTGRLLSRIERALEPLRSRKTREVSLPSGRPNRVRVWVDRAEVAETQLLLAWQTPPFGSQDAVALDVAAVVLGHGDASRLSTRTRRRDHVVSDIYASCHASRLASTFSVTAHTRGAQTESAARAIAVEVRRIADLPIEAEELARARAVLESDLVYRQETVQGRAHALGYYASLTGELASEQRYYQALAALTPEVVRRACGEYLQMPRAVIGALVPITDVSSADVRRLVRAFERVGGTARHHKRRMAPDRHGIHCFGLDCGLRVRVQMDRSVPVCAAWLVWRGGQSSEYARDAGAKAMIASLLTRGASAHSGDALARELDAQAAVLEGFSGLSSMGLHIECTSQHVFTVLRRAFECALRPRFEHAEVEEERRVALQEIAAEQDDLANVAISKMLERLYGLHPFHRSLRGNKRSVRELTRDRLAALWRRGYPMAHAVLGIAGDVDPDDVASFVRELFELEHVPGARGTSSLGAPPKWPSGATEQVLVKRREQAHIAIGYPGTSIADPDAEALELLTAVLGGPSGRLFVALREQEGLVYGVSASSIESVVAGHVVIHASTSQSKLVRALDRLKREERRIVEERIPKVELEHAKAWLIGQHHIALQRRSRIASALAFGTLNELGHAHHLAYPARIERIGAARLLELARRIFVSSRRVQVVMAKSRHFHRPSDEDR